MLRSFPSSKFSLRYYVLGVLFLLVSGVGIATGMFLLGHPQDLRQQAYQGPPTLITPLPEPYETDFEIPPALMVSDLTPGTVLTQTPLTPLPVNLVFAAEQATATKYPNYQQLTTNAIANLNQRLANIGIMRQFVPSAFRPVYNKSNHTDCPAHAPGAGYLPQEYCNHNNDFIYVIIDELAASNYFSYYSLEWHGYNGQFSSQGISVLGHELGHGLGLPDEYHISVKAENNLVNQQAYQPFSGYIMHNLTPGYFHRYDMNLINRLPQIIPPVWGTWLNEPAHNRLQILDTNNNPLSNLFINVYASDPQLASGGLIDTTPEYTGYTNAEGYLDLGTDLIPENGWESLRAFLVQVTVRGSVYYDWFDTTDINLAYWNGETDLGTYVINSIPAPTPTPTPYVQGYVKNSAGLPVNANEIARACDTGTGYPLSQVSSYTKETASVTCAQEGVAMDPSGPAPTVYITPVPAGGTASTFTDIQGDVWWRYLWPAWITGVKTATFIVTTAPALTPTGIPTPTTAPLVQIIVNSATNQRCRELCQNIGKTCVDVGLDTNATDNQGWTSALGICTKMQASCSTKSYPRVISCSGYKTDWTRCRCQ